MAGEIVLNLDTRDELNLRIKFVQELFTTLNESKVLTLDDVSHLLTVGESKLAEVYELVNGAEVQKHQEGFVSSCLN